jgi:hypothetical protein
MNTREITDAYIRINESCHIIDRGLVDIANIVIGEGLQVEYCFVAGAVPVIPPEYSGGIHSTVIAKDDPSSAEALLRRMEAIQVSDMSAIQQSQKIPLTPFHKGESQHSIRLGGPTFQHSYSRHITIGAHTTFVGTGVMMDQIEMEIITEVV